MGLLMNGLVKIPMQFAILLIGVLVFAYYQFNPSPVFFNQAASEKIVETNAHAQLLDIEKTYQQQSAYQAGMVRELAKQPENLQLIKEIRASQQTLEQTRKTYKSSLKKASPSTDVNDTNYVFLRFVVDHLPQGLIGLLIAVIFLAGWGSIAAALNSLASSTMCDIHQQFAKTPKTPLAEYNLSRWYTLAWGVFCIIVAQFANNMGSLIEAVNVLGSLFYGVILGIFLLAFFFKYVRGNAAFYSAIITELIVISLFWKSSIGFLWLNAVGAIVLVLLALILQLLLPVSTNKKSGI
jgi:solute:Na+ symporter, SSS family